MQQQRFRQLPITEVTIAGITAASAYSLVAVAVMAAGPTTTDGGVTTVCARTVDMAAATAVVMAVVMDVATNSQPIV